MKDFDTERRERQAAREMEMGERTFLLGGETFTYRAATSYTILGEIGTAQGTTVPELIDIMESTLVRMLEPGQEDRLLAVLRSDTDPLTFNDLTDLVQWLTEVQTERPTEASSSSTDGGATTTTPSTEDSSSRPAVASTA